MWHALGARGELERRYLRLLSSQLTRAPATTGAPAAPPWCTLPHGEPLDSHIPPIWLDVEVENPHAFCTPPASPLPLFGAQGDSPMSAAAASAASCASTPPTAAYPGLLEKRGARNMTAKPRPTKRAKTEQQFETPPSTPLRRVTEFGQDHVNEVFGFEVKERPVHKMRELLRVFHSMAAHNTAQFEVQGEANVFGFTNVHVLDRASWDEEMLALGTSLSRAPKAGRELKEPKSCIYEILMCYCGMQVVRSNGASSRNKSLMQDSYTFNAEHFAGTKANVNNCRSRKSSQKK